MKFYKNLYWFLLNDDQLLPMPHHTSEQKTEIAKQILCGTVVIWVSLNDEDNVCEECGCLINNERELDLMLCKKCAEENGDWDDDS
jgi:anaerobic ribonucleoside-triphosphate reductase